MAFKLALSAGHGKNTAGKRCLKSLDSNETREWVLNSRIAEKVEKLLDGYDDVEVLRLDDRTGATDVALATRSTAANNFGADFYLAIHHNAGVAGGSGGGIVTYVYTSPSAKSLEWQKELYSALIDSTGLKGNRSAPLAKANLHECREPDMPSVLLELGFMDSSTDVPVILTEKYADQCAEAIVKVIVANGKLTKKSVAATTTALYRVRKSWVDAGTQIGAYTSLENAKVACDKAGSEYHVFDASGKIVYSVASFKVGDVVKLVSGAKYTSGKSVPTWVINSKLYVRQIKSNGDIVVSLLKVGPITGTVASKYVTTYSNVLYQVQVTADALNIRAGAGANYKIKGVIKDKGVYGITAEKNGWGKLASGAGWISLAYTKKV